MLRKNHFCTSGKEFVDILIKEFLAALLPGLKCERNELPLESRACSGVHTL